MNWIIRFLQNYKKLCYPSFLLINLRKKTKFQNMANHFCQWTKSLQALQNNQSLDMTQNKTFWSNTNLLFLKGWIRWRNHKLKKFKRRWPDRLITFKLILKKSIQEKRIIGFKVWKFKNQVQCVGITIIIQIDTLTTWSSIAPKV